MKANRTFVARVEGLEAREVLSSIHYHPATIAGTGTAYQTSVTPLPTGGMQVVDILTGRATDLGPFTGAINYEIGPNGGPLSGTGVLFSVHKYELTFVLSGAVLNTVPYTNGVADDLVFNVSGGTKRFAFATGQGQITGMSALQKVSHIAFRINGQLQQLK